MPLSNVGSPPARWQVAALAVFLVFGVATATEPNLDTLLPRMSRVARLFQDTTLRFACRETITWRGVNLESGRQRFGYVYVYDEDEGFEDYRTWVRTGKRIPREVIPDEFGIPGYLENAFFWIFVFKEERHDVHRYRIVGREVALDRPAVKILFEPIPPYEYKINDWFGWMWIDSETSQPLRVEAYRPEDWAEKLSLEDRLRGAGRAHEDAYLIQKITTDFSVVTNGIRFPGEVRIRRARFRVAGRRRRVQERLVYEVRQRYDRYEFFNVRTEAEVRRILASPSGSR